MVVVVVSAAAAAAAAAVVNFLFEAWIGQKEACICSTSPLA